MTNYNKNYKGIIATLVLSGQDVFEIELGEDVEYYATSSVEKPSAGTMGSSPYIRVKGLEITDLIANAAGTVGTTVIVANVKTLQEQNKKLITYEFSDNHKWRFYNQV